MWWLESGGTIGETESYSQLAYGLQKRRISPTGEFGEGSVCSTRRSRRTKPPSWVLQA
jgi:hypothetical protein